MERRGAEKTGGPRSAKLKFMAAIAIAAPQSP